MYFENDFAKIDKSNLPIVNIYIKNYIPTNVEFQDYLYALTFLAKEKRKAIVICDLRNAPLVNVNILKLQADWFNINKSTINNFLQSIVYIIDNIPMKLLNEFILKLTRVKFNYIIVKNKEEAFEHIKEQLQILKVGHNS